MFLQKADLSLINCDLCTSIALTNFAFENPKGQLESIPCGIRIDINGQCHMIILENEHNPINLLTVEERKEYYNSAARGQQPATCSVCPLTYNKLQAIRHKNEFLAKNLLAIIMEAIDNNERILRYETMLSTLKRRFKNFSEQKEDSQVQNSPNMSGSITMNM